ncbi:MAG: tRNA (uridine(34)/cytosine(34)/5-carboxymethylaminomethyluridine(34)-2'-O)-methyltransferase TrmL [Oscillospiraceae bacterium]|nr:tRNA (uridine(34)/cytosine(34)/5-carboxymethylaminomethyluridine(34)-2'-O)-methyltransferase TrmL [Oscillospiraceae bacterium]
MPNVVLLSPEIPQNTGNIARTCAATGTPLHLIKPLGFELSDRYLKRAGLDYWQYLDLTVHEDFRAFTDACGPERLWALSTRGKRPYTEVTYRQDDYLLFGCETKGLTGGLYEALSENLLRIPMIAGARSMNLSNAVALTLFEALRQNGFAGLV